MNDGTSTIIASFLNATDRLGIGFVEGVYGKLANELGGLFAAMLVLYAIWWGYSIIAGSSTISPLEAAERLGKVFFIYLLVTGWSTASSLFYNFFQKVPENLSRFIVDETSTAIGLAGVTTRHIHEQLGELYAEMLRLISVLYLSVFTDKVGLAFGILFVVLTLIFLGVAIAMITIAKFMLNIFLALGPIWIVLALYNFSSRFTLGFLNLTVMLMVQQVAIYAFFGFYYQFMQRALDTTKRSVESGVELEQITPLMLVMAVGTIVLLRLPHLASLIVGHGWSGDGRFLSAAMARSAKSFRRLINTPPAHRGTAAKAFERDAVRAGIRREVGRNGSPHTR